jgi:hypothetical protein
MSEPAIGASWTNRRREMAMLGVAILVVIVFRLHAFSAALDSDSCNYAVIAERLMAGERLYVDVWDHQPPGMFAWVTAALSIVGPEPLTFRMQSMVSVLATVVLLWSMTRVRFGPSAAIHVALIWAVVSSDPDVAGQGCNREIYMNLTMVAAVWFLLRRSHPRLRDVALCGLCCGVASCFKNVVAAQWLVLLPVALRQYAVGRRWPSIVIGGLAMAAGPLILWSAITTYFFLDGRGGAFIDAVFSYNLQYSSNVLLWERFLNVFSHDTAWRSALPLWIAAAVGVLALMRRWDEYPVQVVLAYALGSYVATALPGRDWHHYHLLMLPPAVLVVGCAARVNTRRARIAVALVGIAVVGWQYTHYLVRDPDEVGPRVHAERMQWVRTQALNVAAATHPDDSIYVWSTDAGFYYYADRRCASRYPMFGPLLPDDLEAAERREHLISDLEKHRPRLILLIAPHPPCQELQSFIKKHKYYTTGFDGPHGMEVLCDITRPIEPMDWTTPR